jgi:hypothetical protein
MSSKIDYAKSFDVFQSSCAYINVFSPFCLIALKAKTNDITVDVYKPE